MEDKDLRVVEIPMEIVEDVLVVMAEAEVEDTVIKDKVEGGNSRGETLYSTTISMVLAPIQVGFARTHLKVTSIMLPSNAR